jgi:hypothetical protein
MPRVFVKTSAYFEKSKFFLAITMLSFLTKFIMQYVCQYKMFEYAFKTQLLGIYLLFLNKQFELVKMMTGHG